MWVLKLNDMRFPKIEMFETVAKAERPEKLQAWMVLEKVADYRDGQWGKAFRKGGPLEWYNEPIPSLGQGIFDIGTEEDWVQQTREDYRSLMDSIHLVE